MEEQSQQTCSPSDTTHIRETRRASEMDLYRLSGGSMLAITFFCWRRRWSEGFQACHIVDHARAPGESQTPSMSTAAMSPAAMSPAASWPRLDTTHHR